MVDQVQRSKLGDPGRDIIPVSPDDDNDLPDGVCQALLIGVAGDLKVITLAEKTRTVPVPVGVLPVQVRKVFATDTTADDISAIY